MVTVKHTRIQLQGFSDTALWQQGVELGVEVGMGRLMTTSLSPDVLGTGFAVTAKRARNMSLSSDVGTVSSWGGRSRLRLSNNTSTDAIWSLVTNLRILGNKTASRLILSS